jgi:hypothetical protein
VGRGTPLGDLFDRQIAGQATVVGRSRMTFAGVS